MVLYCFYTALRSLVALSYHVKVVVSAYYQGYWMRASSMPCTQLLPVSGTPPPRSSAMPPSIRFWFSRFLKGSQDRSGLHFSPIPISRICVCVCVLLLALDNMLMWASEILKMFCRDGQACLVNFKNYHGTFSQLPLTY